MRGLRSFRFSVAIALAVGVSACASPKKTDVTGSLPDDYRERHPITVTRGLATLDLLPGGGPGGLTDRQVADIQEFAADWQKRGRGRLTINVPKGADAVTDRQSSQGAREIRRVLAAMAVPDAVVKTLHYPAEGPGHLAPVRLEFPILEAKVPHECGQWPDDAGFRDPENSNRNRSYWNYGCAYQQNLAAQIEDPEDLIRPRAETPQSATRRSTVLEKYQKGQPTATAYPKEMVDTQ